MEELIAFLKQNEFGIYLFLGVIAFVHLLRMIGAWREWRITIFGLERESAQRRFATALSVMVLLVLFVFAEFFIVTFIAPSVPQSAAGLPTATLDVLATPTITLPALVAAATSPAAEELPTPTALLVLKEEGCLLGQIEWMNPTPGEQISETVQLRGTVNVPNLGFYKYEYANLDGEVWTTIAADNVGKVNGEIGFWNTSQLTPGDYLLRLVVVDNQNQPFPACVIQVRITSSQ